MGREPLSRGAREFISAYVHSVRQLELLLLLRGGPDQAWTAASVAASLRVAPPWATAQLAGLEAAGLLDGDAADQPAYRYRPTAEHDRVLGELDEAYRRRKQTVIQAILSAMDSDVQALSDAFRLRRPSDG